VPDNSVDIVHGNLHVRNQIHIHYNQQAKQHTVLSRSQLCYEYHTTLLLAQADMYLLLSVRLASQTRV